MNKDLLLHQLVPVYYTSSISTSAGTTFSSSLTTASWGPGAGLGIAPPSSPFSDCICDVEGAPALADDVCPGCSAGNGEADSPVCVCLSSLAAPLPSS